MEQKPKDLGTVYHRSLWRDIVKEIKVAGKDKELEKAYKKYVKDNPNATGIMNETEYTRFFYWTRVFVKPAK